MNLAIKGHATRGKEVIEILEMLGGKNVCNYGCDVTSYIYSIDVKGTINWYIPHPDSPLAIFSLEEFIKKFPYKVGDKVKSVRINNLIGRITNVRWHSNENQIIYTVEWNDVTTSTLSYFARGLQPYKEETMEDKGTLVQIDLTKELCVADEVEVILGDYEFILKDGKTYVIKKKPQYPKTYEECCEIMGIEYPVVGGKPDGLGASTYRITAIRPLIYLLICRDAYWKIAGEQMGLGKPWEPDWNHNSEKYVIYPYRYLYSMDKERYRNTILAFPTREMQEAFLENFKDLIELGKELL